MTISSEWVVYLLESQSGRTYVGCTTDISRRLREHNGDAKGGAKSTRGFRPWHVAKRWGPFENRSIAQKIEAQVKKLPGKQRYKYTLETNIDE